MTRSNDDGINYERVECKNCQAEISSDGDGVVFSERLDGYFCGNDCILEYVKG